MTVVVPNAALSGIFSLGGSTPVTRLGYGAMRITGPGVWGDPADPGEAIRVLRRAVELGVDFIDTADAYGPFVSEDLIRQALHPYDGVVIATKGGLVRTGPDQWHSIGKPEYLRHCVEMSLRRLGVETIGLYQLHWVDPDVPLADQIGVLADLRKEGKIELIGLSEVDADQIVQARLVTPIASVQNRFNVGHRQWESVVDYAEREGLGFIPWFPIGAGDLAKAGGRLAGGRLAAVADELDATTAQVALAWLLRRSPVIIPIPGTSSVAHLEENVASAAIELTDAQFNSISAIRPLPSND